MIITQRIPIIKILIDAILNTIMLIKINVNVNSTDSIIISLRSGRLRCDIPELKTLTELP